MKKKGPNFIEQIIEGDIARGFDKKNLRDFYVHDEKNHRFVGEKTGKKYQLGDKTKVMLIKADQIKKRLDFQVLT